jgi:hypothetical protein
MWPARLKTFQRAKLHSSSTRLELSLPNSSGIIAVAQCRHKNRLLPSQTLIRLAHDNHCKHANNHSPVITKLEFWSSSSAWRRAAINTFRCLVGCTAGDFSAMWYLQSFYPDIGIGSIMAISMASGLATSITLETFLLRYGKDRFVFLTALKTALGMSLVSMLSMEAVTNIVDYHLTGGIVAFNDPSFWGAALLSMGAGFLAPLPYNYVRLRKFGKACH